ncbi:carboxylesterase family protein [Streptococcus moroccensis]|uniref:Peptidase n=1 Tax=Streptococcus moroccensis TaxID=1451356 RepID=A0ABT9YQQ0_9STRE|nr:alpha/beta hydrolase-fold protein [Streptococcus moroccensis]MDQ0222323.1 putative peptidase [Streptococcus moroccensis]
MKKILLTLTASAMVLTLAACSTTSETSTPSSETTTSTSAENTSTTDTLVGVVNNVLAEDEDALISATASQFTQVDYTDEETGLTITYNVYLPENYDESKAYPTVVFIGDSSTTGDDATVSLTQGLGANVWACEEWQSVNESIVLVPTYPETILDDHGSYTTTEYVELTKRFIDYASQEYAVDTNRIYGTGQSMGAMTTLILASQYPDLYAGVMIVDGQWDISTLSGLEGQNIVYFAAEDDENAWAGLQEVMAMYDEDGEAYTYAQWDGTWTPDQLSAATEELIANDTNAYFISWASGTIDISDSNFQGSSAYHMASFDYAYRSIAMMEWLFQQSK